MERACSVCPGHAEDALMCHAVVELQHACVANTICRILSTVAASMPNGSFFFEARMYDQGTSYAPT